MAKVRDWSKLFKKYRGKWLALEDDEQTVIVSGKSLKEVYDGARKKGYKMPHITKMPEDLVPIPFFPTVRKHES